jgi:hypothetical protein
MLAQLYFQFHCDGLSERPHAALPLPDWITGSRQEIIYYYSLDPPGRLVRTPAAASARQMPVAEESESADDMPTPARRLRPAASGPPPPARRRRLEAAGPPPPATVPEFERSACGLLAFFAATIYGRNDIVVAGHFFSPRPFLPRLAFFAAQVFCQVSSVLAYSSDPVPPSPLRPSHRQCLLPPPLSRLTMMR